MREEDLYPMAGPSKKDLQTSRDGIQRLMNTASRLMVEPPPNLDGMASRIMNVADDLRSVLYRKGIECVCSLTTARFDKWSCTCAPRESGKAKSRGALKLQTYTPRARRSYRPSRER